MMFWSWLYDILLRIPVALVGAAYGLNKAATLSERASRMGTPSHVARCSNSLAYQRWFGWQEMRLALRREVTTTKVGRAFLAP
ncbi:MAG: hypothetical protein HIU83_13360 [Proteobacteria bacterium]|nr:hypothetical protein [Pseudomonadota bacterium]